MAVEGPVETACELVQLALSSHEHRSFALRDLVAEEGRQTGVRAVAIRDHLRQQLVTALGDGPDVRGIPRVITEGPADLADCTRQGLVGDELGLPDLFDDLLFRDNPSGVASQTDEHVHDLRLEPNGLLAANEEVCVGLHAPVANRERSGAPHDVWPFSKRD